jgi:hypothetical protein
MSLFTLIQAVSPLAVVSSFFSIPDNVIRFPRNTTSFIVSIAVVSFVLQLMLIVAREWDKLAREWNKLLKTREWTPSMFRSVKKKPESLGTMMSGAYRRYPTRTSHTETLVEPELDAIPAREFLPV